MFLWVVLRVKVNPKEDETNVFHPGELAFNVRQAVHQIASYI